MKEIGQKLRETRLGMEISIEEAAQDLKSTIDQIEDVEEGRIEAFKDIFFLKYFIRDYSKYLGLDYEEMVDDFNEYLFDYTSKISLDDIKQAKEKDKKEEKNKVKSPYTVDKGNKKYLLFLAIPFLFLVIVAVIYIIITSLF